jgi:type IV/VI secretion system ImpK/VasF family protein
MKVGHWRLVTELRAEVAKLLDRTLVLGGGGERTVARQHTRYLRDEVARTAYAGPDGRIGGGEAAGLSSGFVERLRLGLGDRPAAVPAAPASLLAGAGSVARGAVPVPINPELLARLRGDLLARIEQLEDRLSKELSEGDVGQMIFPLVLLCDEMVMVRLPKEQHTQWHLLQTELFRINYGGDVFYEFADEQLEKPNTAVEVFETLYYCLQSGFVGRFGFDAGKVQRYRNLLSERILTLTPADRPESSDAATASEKPARKRSRAAARGPRGEANSRRWSGIIYYGIALSVMAFILFLMVTITNI